MDKHNYLKTKEDQISFLKALFRQMNADEVVSNREVGYIRAKAMQYGISNETYAEAEKEFQQKGFGTVSFSSKQAAIQTQMAVYELSASDLQFAAVEVTEAVKIRADMGLKSEPEISKMIGKYMSDYVEVSTKLEAILSKIAPTTTNDHTLDGVYPEVADKKGYIKTLLAIADADGAKLAIEDSFISRMSRAFYIPDEIAAEAAAEYKADPAALPAFTNKYSASCAIREGLRLAFMDNNFSAAEADKIKELVKALGLDIDFEIIDEVMALAEKKTAAWQLRDDSFARWLELV